MANTADAKKLEFHELTPERWKDLTLLFGNNGGCGGCWCMNWRLSPSEFTQKKGEPNRRAFRKLVTTGMPTGILAYANGEPVAWCSVAPREHFIRLEKHRTLKRIDDQPVWSVVCFFVKRPFRGRGVSVALLKAATEWAASKGARIVEGYPTEPGKELPAPFVWTGLASAFRKAGFKEVARPSRTRPVFRKAI